MMKAKLDKRTDIVTRKCSFAKDVWIHGGMGKESFLRTYERIKLRGMAEKAAMLIYTHAYMAVKVFFRLKGMTLPFFLVRKKQAMFREPELRLHVAVGAV